MMRRAVCGGSTERLYKAGITTGIASCIFSEYCTRRPRIYLAAQPDHNKGHLAAEERWAFEWNEGDRMKKRYLWLIVPALLACLRFGPKLVANSETRTEAYFAMQRAWISHWPFDGGKYLPRVILPAMMPVTPVWLTVEPQIRMRLDPEDFVSRTILETGEWEAASWQAMRAHLTSGATFVDVGAQIGYCSLKA